MIYLPSILYHFHFDSTFFDPCIIYSSTLKNSIMEELYIKIFITYSNYIPGTVLNNSLY